MTRSASDTVGHGREPCLTGLRRRQPQGSRAHSRRHRPILGGVTSQDRSAPGAPPQVRLAGALVGVQGLLGLGFAVALTVRALTVDAPGALVRDIVGEAGYFVIMGGALVAVGVGLIIGRRWARTPAIVAQLLLLPVVYTLIGPSHQLVLGIIAGVLVAGTFLLLISEAARTWSMGLDLPDARQ
jgi:hypothetical protein